ncbi:MAG: hypothetical protein S4CHLAM123_15010 [Chlamydiales bacterium]|nr:hypothetical protein [Chlamydiales bacterium]
MCSADFNPSKRSNMMSCHPPSVQGFDGVFQDFYLLRNVLKYLSLVNVIHNCSLVSKDWNVVTKSQKLLKRKFKEISSFKMLDILDVIASKSLVGNQSLVNVIFNATSIERLIHQKSKAFVGNDFDPEAQTVKVEGQDWTIHAVRKGNALGIALLSGNLKMIQMFVQAENFDSESINSEIPIKAQSELSLQAYSSRPTDWNLLSQSYEWKHKFKSFIAILTPLHLAVSTGCIKVIKLLLEQPNVKLDVHSINVAIAEGHFEIAQQLIERYTQENLNLTDADLYTSLCWAAYKGNELLVEIILGLQIGNIENIITANMKEHITFGYTERWNRIDLDPGMQKALIVPLPCHVLQAASMSGNVGLFEMLLEKFNSEQLSLDIKQKIVLSALVLSIKYKNNQIRDLICETNPGILDQLIQYSVDRDSELRSFAYVSNVFLCEGIYEDQIFLEKIISILQKSSVDSKEKFILLALRKAIRYGSDAVINLCIDNLNLDKVLGIPFCSPNEGGPRFIVQNPLSISLIQKSPLLFKMFLAHVQGMNIDHKDQICTDAFLDVIKTDNIKAVETCLSILNANQLNGVDDMGNHALHLILTQQNDEILNLLLTYPYLDVLKRDQSNQTPIHLAMKLQKPLWVLNRMLEKVPPHLQYEVSQELTAYSNTLALGIYAPFGPYK